jgi:hypothetical protein
VLKRALFIAALLALTTVLAPVFAQRVSEEIFVPAGFDPFDPEILTDNGLVLAPCTDAGLAQEPLPDGAEGFTIAGEFLQVKRDDLCRAFTVPLRVGVPYKAIYIEFDLDLDRWVTPIFHNIASLRRPGPKRHERVLYWGLIIRGDRRRTLLDLGAEKSVKQDHPWQEQTRYHLVMEANIPGKRIKMDVFNADGSWVFGTQGKMTAREIRSLGGERSVKVDFSSGGIAHHAYFPPTGWTFSNLKVTAVP